MNLLDNGVLDAHSLPKTYSRDLPKILALISVASPSSCAYRMFKVENHTKALAKEFVGLFNKPESMNILDVIYEQKRKISKRYFKRVLDYCANGNLQSVLDEWSYVLNDEGDRLIDTMRDSFIRTTRSFVDTDKTFNRKGAKKKAMRNHFGVGYFKSTDDDTNTLHTNRIRNAFNSPFRPFVLATTSIGQEGLDFHLYCRKIVHWNLPSNPIDLEQREGRINRYQCLAIRQNIVKRYGNQCKGENIWPELFQAAESKNDDGSGLMPCWCLPNHTDDIPIERIVPMYPFSNDEPMYKRIIEIVRLYRLTLGQPRQEELMRKLIGMDISDEEKNALFINLSPYYKE
jgi:hypothetical protein